MTSRFVYIPKTDEVGVVKKRIMFDWYPGFAVSQKQKSINSLHKNAKLQGLQNILEVSSKSPETLGVLLSAFNLSFKMKSGRSDLMESVFQGSKVFEKGGPFIDLYYKAPVEAKKDERLKNSGNLIRFEFNNRIFKLNPKTLFYDWLYINIINQNKNILDKIAKYDGFTDIEFNPDKSINCQAYSVALVVSLLKNNVLDQALVSLEDFMRIMKKEYRIQDPNNLVQIGLGL